MHAHVRRRALHAAVRRSSGLAGEGQLQEAAALWRRAAELFPEWLRAPLLKRASWLLGRCLTRAAQTQRLQALVQLAELHGRRGLLRRADCTWRKVLREGQFRSGDEEAKQFGLSVASLASSSAASSGSAASDAVEAKTRPAPASHAERARAAREAVTETLLSSLDGAWLQRSGLSREELWAPVAAPAPSIFQPYAKAAAARLKQWQAHADSDLRSQLEHARESAAALEVLVWTALRAAAGAERGEAKEEDWLSEAANLVGELFVKLHHVLDQAVTRWVNHAGAGSACT